MLLVHHYTGITAKVKAEQKFTYFNFHGFSRFCARWKYSENAGYSNLRNSEDNVFLLLEVLKKKKENVERDILLGLHHSFFLWAFKEPCYENAKRNKLQEAVETAYCLSIYRGSSKALLKAVYQWRFILICFIRLKRHNWSRAWRERSRFSASTPVLRSTCSVYRFQVPDLIVSELDLNSSRLSFGCANGSDPAPRRGAARQL